MKEIDVIAAICSGLKRSPRQHNAPFEADAELVELGGRVVAFTADEFSAEDMLSTAEPELLGWNLATGTLSDLLAVRARPEIMLHSVVVGPDVTAGVLEGISAGLARALDAFGAELVGGDVGTADAWRYTGFAVGSFDPGDEAITRRIPVDDGLIVTTGVLGDANLAAAGGAGSPRFECRLAESRLLRPAHAACIDTSDGLARALETLARVNPDVRIEIDLDAVPYADGVADYARRANVRREAFLFASAGEYELLAAVAKPLGRQLVAGGQFAAIGSFSRRPGGGIYYRMAGRAKPIAHRPVPDPRDVGDIDAYRHAVVAMTQDLFG